MSKSDEICLIESSNLVDLIDKSHQGITLIPTISVSNFETDFSKIVIISNFENSENPNSPNFQNSNSPNFKNSNSPNSKNSDSPNSNSTSQESTPTSTQSVPSSYESDEEEYDVENEVTEEQVFQGRPNGYVTIVGRSKSRTILPDLDELLLPGNIKIEANEIYKKMNLDSRRSGRTARRKKLLFLCVYHAYTSLQLPCDPKVVAEIVGIKTKDINKAFGLMHSSSYKPEAKFYKPVDFLPEYCKNCRLNEESCKNVILLAEEIWRKGTDLNRSFPQVVAVGILMYYLDIHGIVYSPSLFTQMVKKAEATLLIMKNKVATVHNS